MARFIRGPVSLTDLQELSKSSLQRAGRDTRAPNIAVLHDTIALCFGEVLQNAGPGVRQVVDRFLSKSGISESDISTRFGDVEKVVTDMFGAGGRITLSKVCDEYSLRLDISYATSLHDRLEQLKERILVERLLPKRYRRAIETATFEDKVGTHAPWTD